MPGDEMESRRLSLLRHTPFIKVLVPLLALGWLGCERKDTTPPTNVRITGGITADEVVTGARTVTATAEDDSGHIAKIEILASSTVICSDEEEKHSGETFSCSWDSSTIASGRYELVAKAYDPSGNAAVTAAVPFTIPAPNRSPTITGTVTASPTSIEENATTTLSVTANDPDGDTLSYEWTQASPATPAGTFAGTGSGRTWTAPGVAADTVFTLRVTVSDGRGGTVQGSVDVTVTDVPTTNEPPVVAAQISAPGMALAGETIDTLITASDPENDTLTYVWATNPVGQGTFTGATTPSATWRSPDVSAATTFTITVSVTDGRNTVSRSKDVVVNVPTYAAHIQPIFDQKCLSCHSGATTRGNLNLSSTVSYDNLVTNGTTTNLTCNTLRRVQPNEPDNSTLVRKISGVTCGNRMPRDDVPYFDVNPGLLTRIRSWILAGAQNN